MAYELNKVTYYQWGKEKQVNVWLDNRPHPPICENLLERIFEKADLPECQLALILDKENGFEGKRGVTIFWEDRYDAISYRDIEDFDRIGSNFMKGSYTWNYLVYIPKITVDIWNKFESYFDFVIWHEFEHVKVMHENLSFHRFVSWLMNNERYCKFFGQLCSDFHKREHKRPLELHCNKESKRLALKEYRKQFIEELRDFKDNYEQCVEYKDSIQFLLGLQSSAKDDTSIAFVHQQILEDIEHAGTKDKIYRVWENEKEQGLFAKKVELSKFLPR